MLLRGHNVAAEGRILQPLRLCVLVRAHWEECGGVVALSLVRTSLWSGSRRQLRLFPMPLDSGHSPVAAALCAAEIDGVRLGAP